MTTYLVLGILVLVFVLAKRTGQISAKAAAGYLKDGALLIDVRSAGEFNSGHLRNAINLPHGEIGTTLPGRAPEKDEVLLLHCQSGTRSGLAAKTLKNLGYSNAFNLGSYGRAASIVKRAEA